MFLSPAQKIEKYFKKHPEIKKIVITGSYGTKSAIYAISSVLSSQLNVSLGVNTKETCDLAILDFNSMNSFPNISADIVALTSCRSESDLRKFAPQLERAKFILVNMDDIAKELLEKVRACKGQLITYGDEMPADYYYENVDFTIDGFTGTFIGPDGARTPADVHMIGEHNIRPVTLAFAIAELFQIPREQISNAIEKIRPLRGRMSPARGINSSIVIDDSADISAISIKNGIHAISALPAPSRIVVIKNLRRKISYNPEFISEIIIIDPDISVRQHGIFRNFHDEVSAIQYLQTRAEAGGIILLECPLPEIIISYKLD